MDLENIIYVSMIVEVLTLAEILPENLLVFGKAGLGLIFIFLALKILGVF